MNEIQTVAMCLLDNYKKGNKWISQLDVQGGYEINKNGVIHVYYPTLSRRVSQIKINGKPIAVDKYNNIGGTAYTGYRLNSNVRLKDVQDFIDGKVKVKKSKKKIKETLMDKLLAKLGF